MLQEQLNTYRSQRIAKLELLEQESIRQAQEQSRRQQDNERGLISERNDI